MQNGKPVELRTVMYVQLTSFLALRGVKIALQTPPHLRMCVLATLDQLDQVGKQRVHCAPWVPINHHLDPLCVHPVKQANGLW